MIEGRPQPGQVLSAGDVVLQIAPRGERRFNGFVDNSEIAGIEVGQKVRIKLDAYPYQQYGTLDGRITFISPDAKRLGVNTSETPAGPSGYEVRVELAAPGFGPGLPIELGMTGRAEILRGSESVLALAFRRMEDKVRIR